MPPIDLDYDLLNYIAQKRFQPGERLPTITELQDDAHLGVSISKVREQLEVARALGLVEVRSKTGMKMKAFSFTPAVRLSLFYAVSRDAHAFEQFGTLRNHVEVAFWHEACATLTEADIATMRACVETARQKLNRHYIPNDEHRTFHLAMFTHLDNPFVLGILEAYWDAYSAIEPARYADYTYHQSVWNYHERILDAICAQDFDGAQALFIEHTRLLRYESEAPPASASSNGHE